MSPGFDKPLKERDVMLKTYSKVRTMVNQDPSKLFTRSEISKSEGVDMYSLNRIFRELRDEGIVTEFRDGDKRYYRLKKKGESRWIEKKDGPTKKTTHTREK
jgi:DNA-binding transcriptional ArsR family regulator